VSYVRSEPPVMPPSIEEPEPPERPNIIYVDAEAAAGGNGMSWATAFRDLQDALSAAASNATSTEIWVAEGTYRPDRGTGNRLATFDLSDGIALYGDFEGTDSPAYPGGETQRTQRDYLTNQTTLSGDLAGNDIAVTDDAAILWDHPTLAENSVRVVDASYVGPGTILDGFVITGGNAVGSVIYRIAGGGVLSYRGSPTIAHCTFTANTTYGDGGGLYVEDGDITLVDCVFSWNAGGRAGTWVQNAGGHGAAVFVRGNSHVTISNCIFAWNTGLGDAAAIFLASPGTIDRCVFLGNVGGRAGAGHDGIDWGAKGGAIMLGDRFGGATVYWITNCLFVGNSSHYGGAICDYWARPDTRWIVNCTDQRQSFLPVNDN
jgi:predicted outer membrane repeat protein